MKRVHQVLAGSGAVALLSTAIIAAGAGSAFAGVQACNGNTVNWAALYPTTSAWVDGSGATACIGDKNTWSVSSAYSPTQVFCAGNNNGKFWYHDEHEGTSGSHAFSYDTSYYVSNGTVKTASWTGDFSYADNLDVYQVQITGWTGSAGC